MCEINYNSTFTILLNVLLSVIAKKMSDQKDEGRNISHFRCVIRAVFTSKYTYLRSYAVYLLYWYDIMELCLGYEFSLYQHYFNPQFSKTYP